MFKEKQVVITDHRKPGLNKVNLADVVGLGSSFVLMLTSFVDKEESLPCLERSEFISALASLCEVKSGFLLARKTDLGDGYESALVTMFTELTNGKTLKKSAYDGSQETNFLNAVKSLISYEFKKDEMSTTQGEKQLIQALILLSLLRDVAWNYSTSWEVLVPYQLKDTELWIPGVGGSEDRKLLWKPILAEVCSKQVDILKSYNQQIKKEYQDRHHHNVPNSSVQLDVGLIYNRYREFVGLFNEAVREASDSYTYGSNNFKFVIDYCNSMTDVIETISIPCFDAQNVREITSILNFKMMGKYAGDTSCISPTIAQLAADFYRRWCNAVASSSKIFEVKPARDFLSLYTRKPLHIDKPAMYYANNIINSGKVDLVRFAVKDKIDVRLFRANPMYLKPAEPASGWVNAHNIYSISLVQNEEASRFSASLERIYASIVNFAQNVENESSVSMDEQFYDATSTTVSLLQSYCPYSDKLRDKLVFIAACVLADKISFSDSWYFWTKAKTFVSHHGFAGYESDLERINNPYEVICRQLPAQDGSPLEFNESLESILNLQGHQQIMVSESDLADLVGTQVVLSDGSSKGQFDVALSTSIPMDTSTNRASTVRFFFSLANIMTNGSILPHYSYVTKHVSAVKTLDYVNNVFLKFNNITDKRKEDLMLPFYKKMIKELPNTVLYQLRKALRVIWDANDVYLTYDELNSKYLERDLYLGTFSVMVKVLAEMGLDCTKPIQDFTQTMISKINVRAI